MVVLSCFIIHSMLCDGCSAGFTLAESYLVGTISSRYDTDVVLIAFGICMGITIGLTLFAFQVSMQFVI